MQGICLGMLGTRVKAEFTMEKARAYDFDAVIVVGGAGSPDCLWDSAELHHVLR